ncbi:TetR family transcriptional regulator [Tissierella carlieri]|uniref:TetR family transcriptional regulator n=1 Tax=Tissierella carlieri TaxID=689904 RepID=A0ABT1SAI8_9FIRM|nr:TetR family transcriptional regulator [Tissierella carlieri]MCQ4923325.1 TetR family transcriptional regulator [Tissierella carlieri]MDU5080722.1 TetR family transcriptional regulator [Bacillota bacterium]
MSPKVSNQYKINKRKELLEAAKRVFIQKGYIQATMQDIIDEAGISRGALYSYFNNIQHVFEELLKLEDEMDILYFEKEEKSSFWQQLINWIKMQQKNIESINQSLLLCKTEFFLTTYRNSNKTSNPYVIERYKELASSIKGFIEEGVKKEEFKPCMPSGSIALYIISFIDGLMLDTFNLGIEVTKVNEQIDILFFTLRKMLCPIIE